MSLLPTLCGPGHEVCLPGFGVVTQPVDRAHFQETGASAEDADRSAPTGTNDGSAQVRFPLQLHDAPTGRDWLDRQGRLKMDPLLSAPSRLSPSSRPTWRCAHTARLAYYDAADRMLRGEPFKRQAALAKLHASEIAVTNAGEAPQIHGGKGFMNECPVARMWRDSKVLEIGEGTSEVQRMLNARDLGVL